MKSKALYEFGCNFYFNLVCTESLTKLNYVFLNSEKLILLKSDRWYRLEQNTSYDLQLKSYRTKSKLLFIFKTFVKIYLGL